MQIQVNSDKNIVVNTDFTRFVRGEVSRVLERFKDKLTRVEVHLSDVNSFKFGKQDKRCMIEARPAGSRPVVATMASATIESALRGSLNKLRSVLQTSFGRTAKVRRASRSLEPHPAAKRSGGSTRATRKRTAPQNAAKTPVRKRSVAASKSTKRAATKKTRSTPLAATEQAAGGRGPKKKGIYQARRKSWPRG